MTLPRRVRLVDVAAHAQVSVTTVSHALSSRRPVSEATRKRVLDAIAELGYQPNELARSLRTHRTHTVALIIPDITNGFYTALARGFQDVLKRHGYHALVCNTDAELSEEVAYLNQVVSRGVDGIVMAAFQVRSGDLRPALDADIPMVLLAPDPVPRGVDTVGCDDAAGTVTATSYLLDKGFERVGYIGGPPGQGPSDPRYEGYLRALRDRGIDPDPDLLTSTDFTRDGGAKAGRALLDLPSPPRAVVCVNDLVAIGVLEVARERGVSVPSELAVVGFDDIEAASLICPALTSVVNPAREMGQTCARLLLDRIRGEHTGSARRVVLSHGFVTRDSA